MSNWRQPRPQGGKDAKQGCKAESAGNDDRVKVKQRQAKARQSKPRGTFLTIAAYRRYATFISRRTRLEWLGEACLEEASHKETRLAKRSFEGASTQTGLFRKSTSLSEQ